MKQKTSITLDPLTVAALVELASDFEGNKSQAARKAIRDAAYRRGVKLEADHRPGQVTAQPSAEGVRA